MNKGILIDSENETVSYVDVGDYQDIQKKVWPKGETTFGVIGRGTDVVYYDDEAYIRGVDPHGFVEWPSLYPHPLANNLLVLGTDMDTGDSADVVTDIESVRAEIQFKKNY